MESKYNSSNQKIETLHSYPPFKGSEKNILDNLSFYSEIIQHLDTSDFLQVTELKSFTAKSILDYLINNHNVYLTKQLPEIEQLLDQLTSSNLSIPSFFPAFIAWLRQNMDQHFRIEEKSLFPYIELLEECSTRKYKDDAFEKYKGFSVNKFLLTHDDEIENKLSEVKKQIIRSLKSLEELFPYRILIQKLDALEKDLRLHAMIEDHVLIPKALMLEKEVFNRMKV